MERQRLEGSAWDNIRSGLKELTYSDTNAAKVRDKLRQFTILSLSAKVSKHRDIDRSDIVSYAADLRKNFHVKDGGQLDGIFDREPPYLVIEEFNPENIDAGYQLYVAGTSDDKLYCSAVLLTWNIGAIQEALTLSLSQRKTSAVFDDNKDQEDKCCLLIGCEKIYQFLKSVTRKAYRIWFHDGLLDEKKCITSQAGTRDVTSESSFDNTTKEPEAVYRTSKSVHGNDVLSYFRQQVSNALRTECVL